MALIALASAGVDIPTVAPTVAMMLGLGAGIDYALFLTARHRERLAAGDDPATAAGDANGTAGVAVVTAGAIVVVAISGLLAVGIPFVGRMGLAAGVVVAITAVAAVTVMPALLGMAGRRVLGRRGTPRESGRFAERWARGVARRPVVSTLAGIALLLALAAPVLGLRLGQPDDGTKPASMTQKVAYDRLAEGFGAGFNGPLVLAVALPDEDDGTLQRLEAGAKAAPGVAAVSEPVVNEAGDAATLTVIPKTAPQDEATSQLVSHLREQVIPASGARAYVGGATATFDDMAGRVSERLPVFIAVVVGLSLLLLMAAFRSILVPLVSAAFNLLSIGAAYGVVTLAFQTEAGASLLGVAEQPIVSFIPMFMFAILFGLSMDYNVFLLSRVREEYLRTGDAARRGDPRARPHGGRDRDGGRDHDRGLPRLHDRERLDREDDGPRARDRDRRRRHGGADAAGAGRADVARRPRVAPAALARPAAAADRARGPRARSLSPCRDRRCRRRPWRPRSA